MRTKSAPLRAHAQQPKVADPKHKPSGGSTPEKRALLQLSRQREEEATDARAALRSKGGEVARMVAGSGGGCEGGRKRGREDDGWDSEEEEMSLSQLIQNRRGPWRERAGAEGMAGGGGAAFMMLRARRALPSPKLPSPPPPTPMLGVTVSVAATKADIASSGSGSSSSGRASVPISPSSEPTTEAPSPAVAVKAVAVVAPLGDRAEEV